MPWWGWLIVGGISAQLLVQILMSVLFLLLHIRAYHAGELSRNEHNAGILAQLYILGQSSILAGVGYWLLVHRYSLVPTTTYWVSLTITALYYIGEADKKTVTYKQLLSGINTGPLSNSEPTSSKDSSEWKRSIQVNSESSHCVVGIGGAGGNAVNNLIASKLNGINFVVLDTDSNTLEHSLTDRTLLLGKTITRGEGTKGNVDAGRTAAFGSLRDVLAELEPSASVIFIAGLGGGTGTGALPVFASEAAEQGKAVACIVTLPFAFEGKAKREASEQAIAGMREGHLSVMTVDNNAILGSSSGANTFPDVFQLMDNAIVERVTEIISSGVT